MDSMIWSRTHLKYIVSLSVYHALVAEARPATSDRNANAPELSTGWSLERTPGQSQRLRGRRRVKNVTAHLGIVGDINGHLCLDGHRRWTLSDACILDACTHWEHIYSLSFPFYFDLLMWSHRCDYPHLQVRSQSFFRCNNNTWSLSVFYSRAELSISLDITSNNCNTVSCMSRVPISVSLRQIYISHS